MVVRHRDLFRLLLASATALFVANACRPLLADDASEASFTRDVVPFLEMHCTSCHGGDDAEGGIGLDAYQADGNIEEDYELWETVIRLLKEQQMPPADEPQPEPDDVDKVIAAIKAELSTFECSGGSHPGFVTIRRLNRVEYDNTVRDLIGVDLGLADDFPSDDVGHGFDNMGDVLSIPTILIEKYLAAAEVIADRIVDDERVRRRVLKHTGDNDEQKIDAAKRNIRGFANRAFRRPATDEEFERLLQIAKTAKNEGLSDNDTLKTVLTAILVSPHFLFRVELDPDPEDEDGIRELNGFELATRLSYFLWSSMPDEELYRLARDGRLKNPDIMADQVRRMLLDDRATQFVANFAGQWLQLRDVPQMTPDPDRFPQVDEELQLAMRRETEIFFEEMIRNDHSLLDFLVADFTFVNERLAEHYGMQDVKGDQFRKVALDDNRRGILTHASVLILTSNPTRTSPVKRGKWILDNILGEPPPAPPPDVPLLDEEAETLGSLREQMEQHRTNENCAVCHRKMDALGFGLENFDAVGAWRDKDGRFEIDASGMLPGGQYFGGPVDLMQILAEEKKDEFCRCVVKKMLTYALGRGLEPFDQCTVNDIMQALAENDYRFSTLFTAIVTSDPFTMREARRE